MPLYIFTQLENKNKEAYGDIIKKENLEESLADYMKTWYVFEDGKFEENLYKVPHDSLVILGAFGHGIIKDFFFGSKMEVIQSVITNNFLIAGPKYRVGT
ncbi:MAG: hypothetical protein GY729_02800 [Desulfobacteraceae bacterium]|nr:hypothetical protein [Desulfobacteraceae bacterium]